MFFCYSYGLSLFKIAMKELCCIYILLLLVNLLPYNEDKIKELYKVIQSSKRWYKNEFIIKYY